MEPIDLNALNKRIKELQKDADKIEGNIHSNSIDKIKLKQKLQNKSTGDPLDDMKDAFREMERLEKKHKHEHEERMKGHAESTDKINKAMEDNARLYYATEYLKNVNDETGKRIRAIRDEASGIDSEINQKQAKIDAAKDKAKNSRNAMIKKVIIGTVAALSLTILILYLRKVYLRRKYINIISAHVTQPENKTKLRLELKKLSDKELKLKAEIAQKRRPTNENYVYSFSEYEQLHEAYNAYPHEKPFNPSLGTKLAIIGLGGLIMAGVPWTILMVKAQRMKSKYQKMYHEPGITPYRKEQIKDKLEHIDDAIAALKAKKGSFGKLLDANDRRGTKALDDI